MPDRDPLLDQICRFITTNRDFLQKLTKKSAKIINSSDIILIVHSTSRIKRLYFCFANRNTTKKLLTNTTRHSSYPSFHFVNINSRSGLLFIAFKYFLHAFFKFISNLIGSEIECSERLCEKVQMRI